MNKKSATYNKNQAVDPTKKEITARARLFYCQLISGSLTLNLKSVNRWWSCVWLRVFPFVCVSLSSQTRGSVSGEEAVFKRFSLLITPQSLHLSVHQPELMDLSADRQTAPCQLCVQPDNSTQCTSSLFPEMTGWTARLYYRWYVCVCVCMFFCLVWLFVHFCVCPSIPGLFPLLTMELNMLNYKSKQDRWLYIENMYKKHTDTECISPTKPTMEVLERKSFKIWPWYIHPYSAGGWQDIHRHLTFFSH